MKKAAKIYDLSPKISPRLAVFPGDQPFERQVLMSWAKGNHLELSSMLTTLHIGSHADAPSHYDPQGESIEYRSLGRYMGLVQVMRVMGLSSRERVKIADLPGKIKAPRVLIDTGSFLLPDKWSADFNSFSPELLEHLGTKKVCLVGIDTPSIDPADSRDLESHQILKKYNMSVLEGLCLNGVPEGLYTLVALPLPIEGGDASPVRAVLLPKMTGFPNFI